MKEAKETRRALVALAALLVTVGLYQPDALAQNANTGLAPKQAITTNPSEPPLMAKALSPDRRLSRSPQDLAAMTFSLAEGGSMPTGSGAFAPGDFKKSFFDVLKKVFAAAGEDPDQIEMARYFIDEPAHAEVIYSYVAKEDYVFIGILMAAKAARGQTIKGVGTFDQQACNAPLTLFNAVFTKSSDFMSKYSNDPNVQALAKEGNQKAKAEAEAAMEKYVPYWKDIPHICNFTFNTNFQREQDVRHTVAGGARKIKDSYKAFSNGDIVNGVGDLLSIGINGHAACSMADDLIGGNAIGKTPVLGALAKEACAGFAGAIIKGIGAGISAGIDELSNVGDWFAGQSQHMPPENYYALYWAPRVSEGVANARAGNFGPFLSALWHPCESYFDTHKMSGKHAREVCDYHRDVLFKDAVMAKITEEDKISANKKEIDEKLPKWARSFLNSWRDKCGGDLNDPCSDEIVSFYYRAMDQGFALKEANALGGWSAIETALSKYPPLAAQSIERSRQRSAAINRAITGKAVPAWAQIFIGVWTPKCGDDICVKKVKALVDELGVYQTKLQQNQPDESSLSIQKMVNAKYIPLFQKEIDSSKNRGITGKAVPAWAQVFIGTWTPRCADDICVKKVKALVDELGVYQTKLQQNQPDESSLSIQKMVNAKYIPLFQREVDAAKNRVITGKAVPAWAQIFIGVWTPKCGDDVCIKKVKELVDELGVYQTKLQQDHPDESSLGIQKMVNAKYIPLFQKEIDSSKNRGITGKAVPAWAQVFIGTWTPRCADDICVKKVKELVDELGVYQTKLQQDHPDESSLGIQKMVNSKYGPLFQKEIDSSKNRGITGKAVPAWAQVFIGTWTPRCADDICVKKVKELVDQLGVYQTKLQQDHPDESSLGIQKMVNSKYGPLFQKEVDAAKNRQLLRLVPIVVLPPVAQAQTDITSKQNPKTTPKQGVGNPAKLPPTVKELFIPDLQLRGSESVQVNATVPRSYHKVTFSFQNWDKFPAETLQPTAEPPSLPPNPCRQVKTSTRLFAILHYKDGTTHSCTPLNPKGDFYFLLEKGKPLPDFVYVTVVDRVKGTTYESSLVSPSSGATK